MKPISCGLRPAFALALTCAGVAAGATISGCGSSDKSTLSSPEGSTPTGTVTKTQKKAVGRSVPLKIVKQGDGTTVAIVQVFVADKGPFPFIVDTGASQTVIDAGLVHRLKIPVQGDQHKVAGVSGSTHAEKVGIRDWTFGTVKLPPQAVVTISTPIGKRVKKNTGKAVTFGGLLGSDVLRTFGVVAIDFKRDELLLNVKR